MSYFFSKDGFFQTHSLLWPFPDTNMRHSMKDETAYLSLEGNHKSSLNNRFVFHRLSDGLD